MSRIANHKKYKSSILTETGVTLVEMLVYMVIAGMLLGMAVTAFLGQNKSYNRQEVISEIQQNIRGATEQIASDIRHAGVGFFESATVEAFQHAYFSSLTINQCSDDEYFTGSCGSTSDQISVHYRLNGTELGRAISSRSADPDITADDAGLDYRPIAENIDAFRLEYQLFREGNWSWEDSTEYFSDIRAVKIMMVGTSRPSAFNQDVGGTYVFPLDDDNPDGAPTYTPPPNSGYKRLMTTVVQARNNRD